MEISPKPRSPPHHHPLELPIPPTPPQSEFEGASATLLFIGGRITRPRLLQNRLLKPPLLRSHVDESNRVLGEWRFTLWWGFGYEIGEYLR